MMARYTCTNCGAEQKDHYEAAAHDCDEVIDMKPSSPDSPLQSSKWPQPDPNQNIEQQITDIMDSYIRRDMEELIDVEGAERELLALIQAQADKARVDELERMPDFRLLAPGYSETYRNARLAALKKEQQ